MANHARFVINRAAFRDQVLKSPMLQRQIQSACEEAAWKGIEVESRDGINRSGAVMSCPERDETKHGLLTQATGRLRL
ncbi:hypothetical protein BPY_06820 [Bifidobacterium psychraerophilum]|uniref:hypothetical protein n=1 Tax=Bifidobacterium psychraerophilum TaxID=218140 RepID=UPI0031185888